jgi:hypothetical protein
MLYQCGGRVVDPSWNATIPDLDPPGQQEDECKTFFSALENLLADYRMILPFAGKWRMTKARQPPKGTPQQRGFLCGREGLVFSRIRPVPQRRAAQLSGYAPVQFGMLAYPVENRSFAFFASTNWYGKPPSYRQSRP